MHNSDIHGHHISEKPGPHQSLFSFTAVFLPLSCPPTVCRGVLHGSRYKTEFQDTSLSFASRKGGNKIYRHYVVIGTKNALLHCICRFGTRTLRWVSSLTVQRPPSVVLPFLVIPRAVRECEPRREF